MYGLLGKDLSHSFSKRIHDRLRPRSDYRLLETEDPGYLLGTLDFQGLNVTNPYKSDLLQYMDQLDEAARETRTLNTIVKEAGRLVGYNTDYLALVDIFKKYTFEGPLAILGNGSTMRSAKLAAKTVGIDDVAIYARNPEAGERPLADFHGYYQSVVHATPVGTTPELRKMLPVDFTHVHGLKNALDVVYNPLKTRFLQAAEQAGAKVVPGLEMLVRQAVKSHRLFTGDALSEAENQEWLRYWHFQLSNIVLIGLPLSGKTHYAFALADVLGKAPIDVDSEIERRLGASVENIFQTRSEAEFRRLERATMLELAKGHERLIATGGGAILHEQAMQALSQNGLIVLLDLDERIIDAEPFENRPLVKTLDDFRALKEERQVLYQKYADLIVTKDTWDENTMLERLKEAIDAHFGD